MSIRRLKKDIDDTMPHNLDQLLRQIENKPIDASDIKSLVVQYVLETPDHKEDIKGHRSKLRLEALRLLAELTKMEQKSNNTDATILSLIKDVDNEDSE